MEMILILPLGVIVYFLLEGNNPATLGHLSTAEKWQSAFFMSISSRMAGFTLFDIHAMNNATPRLIIMLFMFIGAAPVSTAGGIRTTTIGLLLLSGRGSAGEKMCHLP